MVYKYSDLFRVESKNNMFLFTTESIFWKKVFREGNKWRVASHKRRFAQTIFSYENNNLLTNK